MSQIDSAIAAPSINSQPQEFEYKPVPIGAPASIMLGLVSALGLLTVVGLAIALAGVALALITLLRIKKSDGVLGGKLLASLGFAFSVFFFAAGTSVHAYTYAHEVPEGYQRVNFTTDISRKGVVREGVYVEVHPEVEPLLNKPIFIKGYMYPEEKTSGIKTFLLVKDSAECCFGGKPALEDMIQVEVQGDLDVNFDEGLVSVAGVFRRVKHYKPGDLNSLYVLDAKFFEPARTAF